MKKLNVALPHIVAVVIFIVLGSIYFAPQFEGYTLHQSDIQNALGMSKEISDYRQLEKQEPLWTGTSFSGMPAYQISMIAGTNILASAEGYVFKIFKTPLAYLVVAMLSFYVLLLCFGVSPWLSVIGAIAFGFSSIHMLYLGGGHNTKVHAIALMPGIVGSIVYAYRNNFRIGGLLLCVFISLHLAANHIQETYYLIFMIAAIVVIELYRSITEKLLVRFLKASAFLVVAAAIGVLPTISNLMLTNEYGKYSSRGESDLTIVSAQKSEQAPSTNSGATGLTSDYIKEYSFGYGEIWSLAIPNIKGGASNRLGNVTEKINDVPQEYRENIANFPSYWGEQSFTGGAFYFGATIFLLFILGMVFVTDKLKWAFLATAILAIFLSWKYSAVLDWFINHFPMFNKFRDTKMILVLIQIVFPLTGLLFLNHLINNQIDKKKLLYAIGAPVALFILFYLMPSVWFGFFSNDELEYFGKQVSQYPQAAQQIETFKVEIENLRVAIFKADVLRSVFFMLLIGGAVVLYNMKKLKKEYFILAIGLLVVVDLWMVDKRYLNNKEGNGGYEQWVKIKDLGNPYRSSVADNQILQWETQRNSKVKAKVDSAINAAVSTTGNLDIEQEKEAFAALNFATNYRVFTLQNPFANAGTSYYHKSIGGYHGAKLKRYVELIDFRLNKEYQLLISAFQTNKDSAIQETMRASIPTLNMLNMRYIIYSPEAAPIRNPYAAGNAWFAHHVKMVKNADEEIQALDNTNPIRTAIIDEQFSSLVPQKVAYDSTATITEELYRPNKLVYQTSSQSEQLAVFSEIYYKDGWNAYIDGKLTPHLRANYVLRGLAIPAGKHTVEFRFEPATYYKSLKMATIGTIMILLFVGGVIAYEVFIRFKKEEQTA